MQTIKSRLHLLPIVLFFAFVLAGIIISILCYRVIYPKLLNSDHISELGCNLSLVFPIFYFIMLIVFCGKMGKRLTIHSYGMRKQHFFLPFWRKEYAWNDFDFFITVEEQSKHDTFEAIWLAKNNRLVLRVSSFMYSNYAELKSAIQAKDMGFRDYNSFEQLCILIGIKSIGEGRG